MKKRVPIEMLPVLLVFWAGAGMLRADDRYLWRSWGVRDGFPETYSYALSMAPQGNAYIRHGAVISMSLFDGYGVTRIPDPRGNTQPYCPSTKRVYAGAGGSLWTASLDALQEYRNGAWVVRASPPAGPRLSVARLRRDRLLLFRE